jgi:hypothetical protein
MSQMPAQKKDKQQPHCSIKHSKDSIMVWNPVQEPKQSQNIQKRTQNKTPPRYTLLPN